MLLGTLSASLVGNLLTAKGMIRAGERAITTSQGLEANMPVQGAIRTGQDFWCQLILKQILKFKSIVKTNLNL